MNKTVFIPNIYLRTLYHFFILAGILMLSVTIMGLLATGIIQIIWDIDANVALENPKKLEFRKALILLQTFSQFGILLSGLIYIRLVEKFWHSSLTRASMRPAWDFIIIFILVFALLPFIDWTYGLNKSWVLEFLGKNSWASDMEANAEKMTNALTNFKGYGQFFLMLFVIAVMPAFAEELVFRGIIQRKLSNHINPHLAIWIAALIFSLIHFQMFGLIPRMILGAAFGYLYYWSKSLSLAIYAHFLNNGLALFAVFINDKKTIEEINHVEGLSTNLLIGYSILAFGLLFLFRSYYIRIHKRRKIQEELYTSQNFE